LKTESGEEQGIRKKGMRRMKKHHEKRPKRVKETIAISHCYYNVRNRGTREGYETT